MVKWALLIFLIIILLYFSNLSVFNGSVSNLSVSKLSEGFTQETLYDKAVDRANPLAASESPRNPKLPIGISQVNGVSQKNMFQTALNIPTSITSNGVSFTQATSNNQVSPRIDNENSLLGLSKFCKDNAIGARPFDNAKFNENCGICLTSGSLADGTPFNGEAGLVVYNKDKEIFLRDASNNRYPFTRAIPSIKDGSRVSCNDSSKGSDAKPVFAINQEDYDTFKKRAACIHNNQIGNECGLCLNNNNISWVNPDGNFKSTTLYVWGSGSATLRIGGALIGSAEVLDTAAAKSFEMLNVKEGDNIELTIDGSGSSVYGAISSRTPVDGKYALAIDKFLLIDGETGQFPRSGGSKSVSIEGVPVSPLQLKAQTNKTKLSLRGNFPLSLVDSDQLASYDCPNAPYVTTQDSNDIFGTGGSCVLPKGQVPGNYTDECLKATIVSAGCSTGGEWYSDLDILRTDMGAKSLAEITTTINAGSSTDIEFQRKCKGVDITTPCDPFLTTGSPNKACLTYLYNGGDSKWVQRGLGAIYSGSSSGDKCTPVGTMNPENSNSELFTIAIQGIDAVKNLLTQTLQKSRGNLDINKPDADGGRNTSYNKCVGPSPIPTPPPPPASPAPPDPPTNPSISNMTSTGNSVTLNASWGTPSNKGATATSISSYTITLFGKLTTSQSFTQINSTENIQGTSTNLTYTKGQDVYEKWYFKIIAINDKGLSSTSVQSNTFMVTQNSGPCPTSVILRPHGTHLSKASETLVSYADIYPNGDYQYEFSRWPNISGSAPSVIKTGVMGSTRADNLGMLTEYPPEDTSMLWNYKLKVTNPGCQPKESAIRVRWW